jgi:hypothetical protein
MYLHSRLLLPFLPSSFLPPLFLQVRQGERLGWLSTLLGLGWVLLFPLATLSTRREGGRKEGREGGKEGGRRREGLFLDKLLPLHFHYFASLPPSLFLPPSLPPSPSGGKDTWHVF